jgi:dTDP-4-dehydrorhamnose reductase
MLERVLITGGSGLLGVNLAVSLRSRCQVTLGEHQRSIGLAGVSTIAGTLDAVDDVRKTLAAARPDVVIHAAGLTSVEACEADPAAAEYINVTLAANVAAACAADHTPLVHISTDHLFPGDRPLASENDPVGPLNTYATTKRRAETEVLELHPSALVARTNFFGWGTSYRRSISDRVIDSLRGSQPITLFTDVFYTPILATELGTAALDLIAARVTGIIHISGDERVSKHDFGLRLARCFGLDAGLIRAGALDGRRDLARRPYDMSLSNARARAALGRSLGSVDAQLSQLKQQEQEGISRELCSL